MEEDIGYNVENITKENIELLWKSFKTVSSDLGWDYWDRENYLYDLPGKWDLSFYIKNNQQIIGYCINSLKDNCVWIHHLIVHNEFRYKGIGKIILLELQKRIIEKNLFRDIGLKVGVDNAVAQAFYKKNGFTTAANNGEYITMKRQLDF